MQVKEPKRKKNWYKPSNPLPVSDVSSKFDKIRCTFNGYSVVVENKEQMKKVYTNGCFGKPNLSKSFPTFGQTEETPVLRKRQLELRKKINNKVKSQNTRKIIVVPDSDSENENYLSNLKAEYHLDTACIKEKLFLSLEEAFFLSNALNYLEIFMGDAQLTSVDETWKLFSNADQYFEQNYIAYYYFRSRQWIVKSGLKFGGDFLLYKEGPEIYHASYVVIIDVVDPENFERRTDLCRRKMNVIEIIGLNRLCENCGKELIICQLMWPKDFTIEKYEDIKNISVNEVLSRRWVPSKEREQAKSEVDLN